MEKPKPAARRVLEGALLEARRREGVGSAVFWTIEPSLEAEFFDASDARINVHTMPLMVPRGSLIDILV